MNEEQLKESIDRLITNQKLIEQIRQQKKEIEMQNLLIVDKLSHMEPTEKFVAEINNIIKSIPVGINIDNLARFQLLRLILLTHERCVIPCDEPPAFRTIMPVDNSSLMTLGSNGLDRVAEVIDDGMEEIIRYLDLHDSPVKKRNKLAIILYLKWNYPMNKILRLNGVKRARMEETIHVDLPELYMNIAKMRGIRR